ncbi:MAG: hypothetical protein HY427_01650 [Candidatus Levybacteria bacterium]|nr:hypothetical protein [Candidatus Levybacteria bacterium]
MDPLDLSRSKVGVSLSRDNPNLARITQGFVNNNISLKVPTHTDRLTMSQVQELERREPGTPHSYYTFYLFDSHGNYAKINIVSDRIDVDEKRIARRFLDRLQVASQMTPDDFELAGSVLDGMKQKLLVALGKTPLQTPDRDSNSPSAQ